MNKKQLLTISEVCEFYARVCSGDIDWIRHHYCYIEGGSGSLFELDAYFRCGRKCPQGVICWDIYKNIVEGGGWIKLDYTQKEAVKDALDFYIAIGKGDFSVLFENNNLFESFQVNRKYKKETLLIAINNVMKLTKELKDSGYHELPDGYEKLRKKYEKI
jgi:hypothetical protein